MKIMLNIKITEYVGVCTIRSCIGYEKQSI